jgi:hypothetical protein
VEVMVKEIVVGVLEIVVEGERDFTSLVPKGNLGLVEATIVPKVRGIEIVGGSTNEDWKFAVIENYTNYSKF